VFGTDHPFFKEKPPELIAGVAAAFSNEAFELAAGENAKRLFRLP
jgi:predicted TIM-barrel fold metal-dependent hydrolase